MEGKPWLRGWPRLGGLGALDVSYRPGGGGGTHILQMVSQGPPGGVFGLPQPATGTREQETPQRSVAFSLELATTGLDTEVTVDRGVSETLDLMLVERVLRI